ncbi:hypothetical protein BC939DRAFT_464838 [Gamsiella multidivaricata]|uniref:uncharacterized protein n=1 Tax=Gamsiella multidivaricata TaxID=101098 RepID=UPI00221FBD44|nr:uncharacterized protein BC939DRAFT_464838 [Gamsiella multidivaricata]KAI7817737.1 hypothetical protein BC939DRAFT_464838 [Gamsiella multidivaricata]
MSDSADSSDSEVYIPRDPVVPLPVTGPRERKKVERFAVPTTERVEKPIVIPEGKGIKLGEILTVSANLDRLKAIDETARGLHRFLFGKNGVPKTLKANLREFNGFADMTEKEEEAAEEKLGKWTVNGLRELIDIFNLETGGDKDAVIERLMVFLKKPEDSGLVPRVQKIALEAKERKAKKLELKKAKLAVKAEKAAALKKKKAEAKKLLAQKNAEAKKNTNPKKSSTDPAKVLKVRSAFDMYVKEHQKTIKEAHPDASRADIYKKLVDKWEAVKESEKTEYQTKADVENAKNEKKREEAIKEAKKKARETKRVEKESAGAKETKVKANAKKEKPAKAAEEKEPKEKKKRAATVAEAKTSKTPKVKTAKTTTSEDKGSAVEKKIKATKEKVEAAEKVPKEKAPKEEKVETLTTTKKQDAKEKSTPKEKKEKKEASASKESKGDAKPKAAKNAAPKTKPIESKVRNLSPNA